MGHKTWLRHKVLLKSFVQSRIAAAGFGRVRLTGRVMACIVALFRKKLYSLIDFHTEKIVAKSQKDCVCYIVAMFRHV